MKKIKIPKTSFRNLYAFGTKLPTDLSLSENPLGCSPNVLKIIQSLNMIDVFDYPDPNSTLLKIALVECLKIDQDSIFIANGSESIIKLIPQLILTKDDDVIIPELTFPMFEQSVRMAGANVIISKMSPNLDIDLESIKNKITSKTKAIFICNPNNPTGKIIPKDKLVSFVKSCPALVILDEANIEFAGETLVNEVKKLKNLLVIRTFSKGFGLAGLRVGFCVGNKVLIESMKDVTPPFGVNQVAQKAAAVALLDTEFINQTQVEMTRERNFLSEQLLKRGFSIVPSSANNIFVNVDSRFDSANDLISKLNDLGISVVSGVSFGRKWKNFIRVSPRLRETNNKFIEALDKILM